MHRKTEIAKLNLDEGAALNFQIFVFRIIILLSNLRSAQLH